MIRLPTLDNESTFPPVHTALEEPDGLLAMGGDLSPKRLITAYQKGIFPWFEKDQPILWWSPNPRCVILPEAFKISKSLKKSYRNKGYTCTSDQSFTQVVSACAASRAKSSGTWITEEMKQAYLRLHEAGVAHSVEIWSDGQLAGGLYGLCMGTFFFGESMFSQKTDASKIALIYLIKNLLPQGLTCVDCQVENPHLMSLGAQLLPRNIFCGWLEAQFTTSEPKESFQTQALLNKQQKTPPFASTVLSIWPNQWNESLNL